MEKLISVALCTFNGVKFLQQQLDSILNQSYRNIEVVIVDDHSTDGTDDLLAKYDQKYPEVKLYHNKQNIGFNANFEKAISLCSGDFIAISDQDDIWEINKLELLYENINENWLIFSNSSFISESEETIDGQILDDHFNLSNKDFKSLLFSNFVTGHTCLFSKEFKPFLIPIPKDGYYDWWMGFVAIYHNKIAYLDQKLTLHRIHQTSVTFRNDVAKATQGRNERYLEILDNLAITKNYKNLCQNDKVLIDKLYKAYGRLNFIDKLFLLKVFYRNYPILFPNLKQRNGLSRLNYAIKLVQKAY